MMYSGEACWLLVATILVAQASLVFSDTDEETDLKLLMLLFRHGDRFPFLSYPNDPNKNDLYGTGQLTNAGKLRMYEEGLYIRERYGPFLGDELKPDTAVLRATAAQRTHASGQLFMAALFPPVESQMWSTGLGQLWQPVSFDSFPSGLDSILAPYQSHCRALKRSWEAGQRELQSKYFNDTELFETLTRETGKPIKTIMDLYLIHEKLKYEESMGLTLPEWSKEVYPHRLVETERIVGEIIANTDQSKKLAGGRLLYTILNWVVALKNGELPPNRRMFVFSAHDITLASVLGALNLNIERQVPFGSMIMFELREERSTHKLGFQIFFRNSTEEPAHLLEIPGCGPFCPVDIMFQMFGSRMVPTYRQWIDECQRLDWLDSAD